jgi:hypothetical protein
MIGHAAIGRGAIGVGKRKPENKRGEPSPPLKTPTSPEGVTPPSRDQDGTVLGNGGRRS